MQKFINVFLPLILLGLAILWVGCGVSKSASEVPAKPAIEQEINETPEWFLNIPKDPDYIYAATVGQAPDIGMAVRIAEHNSRSEIAKQVIYKIQQFVTEAGVSTKITTGATIIGAETVSQKIIEEGSEYQAYVLTRVPIGQVKASIVSTVKADEDLHARLKDSPKYKELVKEVEDDKKKKAEKDSTSG